MFTILRKYRWLLEPLIAVVFFLLWMIAESGRMGNTDWPLFPLLVAVLAVSIGVSRRMPWLAIAIPGAVILLQLFEPAARFSANSWPVYFSILITCFIVSIGAAGHARWLALPTTVSYAIMVAVLLGVPALSDGYGWAGWVGTPSISTNKVVIVLAGYFVIYAVATWLLGFALGSSRVMRTIAVKFETTVDQLHVAEVDLIISRERDRIAGSARSSLAEVRILIESLVDEPEGHSGPTLENLDEFFDRMRGAGLTTTIDRFGDAHELTPGQELAVYRIVQEALTNALKHAGRESSARITMDWRGPGLALTIASVGTQHEFHDQGENNARTTRGLYGMRERARLAGGWSTAGVDDDGDGYLVTAFIPSTGEIVNATNDRPEATFVSEEAAAL